MLLALIAFNPIVGDIEGNARRMGALIDEARQRGATLVVLPELALCGYPPKDLLLQQGFLEACRDHAQRLGQEHSRGITLIFGTPLAAQPPSAHPPSTHPPATTNSISNSIMVYQEQLHLTCHDKRLLPTYDVFDEDRYFTPGERAVIVPVKDPGGRTVRVGLSICEDLWKGEDAGFASRYLDAPDPVAELAAAGCDLLVSPSASPFVLGKGKRHRDILIHHAKRHRLTVASVNQSGGNDDLVFDGHAVAYDPAGRLLCASPGFEESITLVDLSFGGPSASAGPGSGSGALASTPADPLMSSSDEELLFRALVTGTRDYLRKTGFTRAVLGLSGGIDSAVTAAIAAVAIGPQHVTGLLLPSKYSSEGSITDAKDLARRLGMHAVTIPIEPSVTGLRSSIDPGFAAQDLPILGATLPDLTEENLQSRVRGTILMAWSNRTGAIVLTTGNKSELAVGYCTLYGDMNGGLAVLSDVSKQWVYRLARWMNQNHARAGFATPPIPEPSITKPPSAELRPDQTDQDSLPPYDVLDAIIEALVEKKQSPSHAAHALELDLALVDRAARMIALAEYKRKQAALGLKVTTVAFGSGRRMPIAQRWRG